jgi:hypothetical protein
MPNPTRTWTISNNNAFSNQADQQVQFREAVFNLKDTFVNAGWTVTISSNGTTAGAGDNWATDADVVLGTSGNGSWVVLRSPTGWIPNSDQIEGLLYVNDTGANPQIAPFQLTTSTWTGGSTATLPTATPSTTVLTSGDEVIPWTSVVSGQWNSWYSSRGDVMFAVKITATLEFRHFFALTGNVDGDGSGKGDQRWGLFARSSTSAEVLTTANIPTSINWRTSNPLGTDLTNALTLDCLVWDTTGTTSWTNGVDFEGNAISGVLSFFSNDSTEGRYLGDFIDFTAAAPNTPAGTLDDSETSQTQRRIVIGDIWIYVNAADIPLA